MVFASIEQHMRAWKRILIIFTTLMLFLPMLLLTQTSSVSAHAQADISISAIPHQPALAKAHNLPASIATQCTTIPTTNIATKNTLHSSNAKAAIYTASIPLWLAGIIGLAGLVTGGLVACLLLRPADQPVSALDTLEEL